MSHSRNTAIICFHIKYVIKTKFIKYFLNVSLIRFDKHVEKDEYRDKKYFGHFSQSWQQIYTDCH